MINYIRRNWIICLLASTFLGGFIYLTFTGNQFCNCETTETYRDGTTRSHSGGHYYHRFYHK